jgi:hypothetical protein
MNHDHSLSTQLPGPGLGEQVWFNPPERQPFCFRREVPENLGFSGILPDRAPIHPVEPLQKIFRKAMKQVIRDRKNAGLFSKIQFAEGGGLPGIFVKTPKAKVPRQSPALAGAQFPDRRWTSATNDLSKPTIGGIGVQDRIPALPRLLDPMIDPVFIHMAIQSGRFHGPGDDFA